MSVWRLSATFSVFFRLSTDMWKYADEACTLCTVMYLDAVQYERSTYLVLPRLGKFLNEAL